MSTVIQRSYRPQIAPATAGMIADEVPSTVTTRQVETAAGIGFGIAVSQGAAARGCIIGGPAFIGITVRDVTLSPAGIIDPLGDVEPPPDVYPQRINAGVLSMGHIWVVAADGVVAGNGVFYEQTGGTFSDSASGTSARGKVAFAQQPVDGQTITINGTVVTFKASGATGPQVNIGPTLGDTIVALAAKCNTPAFDVNVNALSYLAFPPSPGGSGQGSGANELHYSSNTPGTAGNSIAVTSNVTGATVTAMAGGTAAATAVIGAYWLDTVIAGELARISLGIQR